jgi:K+-transporting ATPase A subunit
VNASQEQNWKQYTLALLAFNLAGFLLLFAVLLLQAACRSTRSTCRARNGRWRSTPRSAS